MFCSQLRPDFNTDAIFKIQIFHSYYDVLPPLNITSKFGNIKILTALNTGDILDVVPLHHHRHVPVGLVDVGGEIENS